jgi:hypothetical protein
MLTSCNYNLQPSHLYDTICNKPRVPPIKFTLTLSSLLIYGHPVNFHVDHLFYRTFRYFPERYCDRMIININVNSQLRGGPAFYLLIASYMAAGD